MIYKIGFIVGFLAMLTVFCMTDYPVSIMALVAVVSGALVAGCIGKTGWFEWSDEE